MAELALPPGDAGAAALERYLIREVTTGDRGGVEQALSAGASPNATDDEGKPKTKAHGETKDGKTKGKGALSLDRCGWCDTEGASRTCSQCRSVVYCSPACQKVSA